MSDEALVPDVAAVYNGGVCGANPSVTNA